MAFKIASDRRQAKLRRPLLKHFGDFDIDESLEARIENLYNSNLQALCSKCGASYLRGRAILNMRKEFCSDKCKSEKDSAQLRIEKKKRLREKKEQPGYIDYRKLEKAVLLEGIKHQKP